MSQKVKLLNGSAYFERGELVELGRRLSDAQLEQIGLREAVIGAEQEHYWRLLAASDLLRGGNDHLWGLLQSELQAARGWALSPDRKSPKLSGNHPAYGEKRCLPPAGTLIERWIFYKSPYPEKLQANGLYKRVSREKFRFVVIKPPFQLILLGDKENLLYLSPSAAAVAATGGSVNGWDFFDIFE
ncbi:MULTISPECIES: DUF4357 domain-containing protein [unclassified Thiocapsa]|uniref:DUF4357 domain-containing protein n=1 Tax=unclassified Thiocapsa TaxID=2641286 RepID=UPI0035B0722D